MGCHFSICSIEEDSHKLLRDSACDAPMFTLAGQTFVARVISVYDGDTMTCVLMFHGIPQRFKVRVVGIDCPEMKPPLAQKNREDEKEAAKRARARVVALVLGYSVTVDCNDVELLKANKKLVTLVCGNFDKYGRLLADVFPEQSLTPISQTLLSEGHAVLVGEAPRLHGEEVK